MEKTSGNYIIRVAITGPESTGKTTLAKFLAKEYNTVWVPEYAREYLNNLGRDYVYSDLEEIARGQMRKEYKLLEEANKILFADTELIVIKIWSIYKYGVCSEYVLDEIKNNPYDLYLLTYPDLEWEYDPLRELPSEEMRLEVFEMYERELKNYGVKYEIVKGRGEDRMQNAKEIVDKYFSKYLD
jgi:NadR type nicotinamide-nucleotide adenylyltransferase